MFSNLALDLHRYQFLLFFLPWFGFFLSSCFVERPNTHTHIGICRVCVYAWFQTLCHQLIVNWNLRTQIGISCEPKICHILLLIRRLIEAVSDFLYKMKVVYNSLTFPKSPSLLNLDLPFRSYGQNTEQGYTCHFMCSCFLHLFC